MTVITNIQDLKDIYHRRVPKMFYDYCESGSFRFRSNHKTFLGPDDDRCLLGLGCW